VKKRSICPVVLSVVTAVAAAQSAKTLTSSVSPNEGNVAADSSTPVRTLDFKLVKPNPGLDLSPVTAAPTQCTPDGSLFLDELDVKDLNKHTVVGIHGTDTRSYSPANISDLHDVFVESFFPTEDVVGFLVRGSKTAPGSPSPGKSPAGIPWDDYHYYIAIFNRGGSYQKSIELPFRYTVSRFAILPSGEYLVSGYDQANSTARLAFLDSSGQLIRNLDFPAFRHATEGEYGSREAAKSARNLVGYVLMTPYKEDILVWQMSGDSPILDVGAGGTSKEISLQPPAGFVFDSLIPSNDRLVALFRTTDTAPGSAMSDVHYSYFDVRPQDGSVSAKLVQAGNAPRSIACESDGTYLSFKRDSANKVILVKAD
jgi:hypothetical protein